MRIIVYMKHIPDTQSERRFEDNRLVRGEDDVLNELDEDAVEATVQLVEEYGSEVIALTMGPEGAEDALMRALQMGTNRDVLITDERLADADASLTALVLAATIQKINGNGGIDLVVTGIASLDSVTSVLPAALAMRPGMPLLGLAHSIGVDPGSGRVTIGRTVDGYDDELTAAVPLVVSVIDQINEPRYPAFAAMKAARKKPMDQVELAELASTPAGTLIEGRPRVIEVLEADEIVRENTRAVIPDSSDTGTHLATYLLKMVR